MVKKGKKFGFLVLVLGQQKYGAVIGNPAVKWDTLEDPGGSDEYIQSKDLSFDQSEGKKKHARKVIDYEKFLGIEGSI